MFASLAERTKIATILNMELGGVTPWRTVNHVKIASGATGHVFQLEGELEGHVAKLIPLDGQPKASPAARADEEFEHFEEVQTEAILTKSMSDLQLAPRLRLCILPQASGYWARCGALVLEKMGETLGGQLSRSPSWDDTPLAEYLELAARVSGELCSAFGRYPVDLKPANTLVPHGGTGMRLIDFSRYGCPRVPAELRDGPSIREACSVAGAFFAYANAFWYTRHADQKACLRRIWDGYLRKVPSGMSRRAFCQLVLGEAAVDHLTTYSIPGAGDVIWRDAQGLCSWERAFLSTRRVLEGIPRDDAPAEPGAHSSKKCV